MARRTWMIIFILILLLGGFLIGMQIHIYEKFNKAFKSIILPKSEFKIEQFEWNILSSMARLKEITIKQQSAELRIHEMSFRFKPFDFSSFDWSIDQIVIKQLQLPMSFVGESAFSKFFSMEPKVIQGKGNHVISELKLEDSLILFDTVGKIHQLKLDPVKLSNVSVPTYSFKGSVDFFVSVIYFSLQRGFDKLLSDSQMKIRHIRNKI